jgi:hypothetical protein
MLRACPSAEAAGHSWRAAGAVLRENDAGRYTVPSEGEYPHQWNWDSALCALGWAEIEPWRAWAELTSLAGARDRSGMVPHMVFRRRRRTSRSAGPLLGRFALTRRGAYLPGAAWWGPRLEADGRAISGITHPPLAATCMRLLFSRAPDERQARGLLDHFHRWLGFLLDQRDPTGAGEPVLIHPWESGRDNAPEWDAPLTVVEPRPMYVRRQDTLRVDAAERPSLEHYRRYLTLVVQGTDARWPQRELAAGGPFRVLDADGARHPARAWHRGRCSVQGRLGRRHPRRSRAAVAAGSGRAPADRGAGGPGHDRQTPARRTAPAGRSHADDPRLAALLGASGSGLAEEPGRELAWEP